jgi:hypothetical protein
MAAATDASPLLRLDCLPAKAASTLEEAAPLRLDFLPTKAESTLETYAALGLKRVASDAEVMVEKQRLAAEWQRHQLVPMTPTPAMRYHGRGFQGRRRLRDSVRDAVSGMFGKVVSKMQPRGKMPRSSTPSPILVNRDLPASTKAADAESNTSAETTADSFENLRWWNLLNDDED